MPSNGLLKPVTPRSKDKINDQAQQLLRDYYPELLARPGRFPMPELFEFTLGQWRIKTAVQHLPAGVEAITVPAGVPYMLRHAVLHDDKHTTVVLAPEVYERLHQGRWASQIHGWP